ncbi:class I SAM-dependent methyltransferase [Ignisphaera sp. 4213-co]|uniref:Class I SAM-dependent methyltransferase n=1 Tax=Ignisphaera cupida TaxID=3050454 RepID=A0ABD4Z7P1_9CREN|nr:class I SAM-dependent methyltransferase [Ignisphaera sp. 4213-co]MDK6029022.1 class I SAM-dependent methyltransferase [Ignisphaera sp. 4213-co]
MIHRQLKTCYKDLRENVYSYNVIGIGYSFWRQRPWPIVEVVKGKNILDLGSGPCVNGAVTALRNRGYVVCFDISKTMAYASKATLMKLNVHGDVVVGDALKMPFRSNSFDGILAIAVIHHIPKPFLIILFTDVKRVLKKLGVFVATVWSWKQRRFVVKAFIGILKSFCGVFSYVRRYVVSWKSRRGVFKRIYYLYDLNELVEIVRGLNMVVVSSGYTWYLKQENKNVYIVLLKND